MKKNAKIIISTICLTLLLFSCKSIETNSDKWTLTWEENFNDTVLDSSIWSKIPRGTSDWNNYMSDYDSLFAFENGSLILRGINNTVLPNDTAPYLTGGIFTKDKKTFGFGRLEIHAKLNGATGAWPAFWMLPAVGNWPHGGEIDIMERLSYDDFAYQTVHTYYTKILGIDEPQRFGTSPINPDDYNTYIVEKHPDSLVFYINNVHTFTYPRIETDKEGQFPFADQEYFLMLDMQLGGNWVGAVDPNDLPVEMAIDWVRFYEKNK